MNWRDILKPTLPVLVGTVALTALFIWLEARTIANTCATLRCAQPPSGWITFSAFPHCCGSYSLAQLLLEYALLVLAPLIIAYVLVAIGHWAYRNRKSPRDDSKHE